MPARGAEQLRENTKRPEVRVNLRALERDIRFARKRPQARESL